MSIRNAVIAVLFMALVTYIPRVLPITVFRKEIKSRFVQSFLYYVPFAVLGSLTFPDVFYSTGNVMTALAGTTAALILAYRKKSLVVVAAGAMIAVFLAGFLL